MFKLGIVVVLFWLLSACATSDLGKVDKFQSRCPELSEKEKFENYIAPSLYVAPMYPRSAAREKLEGYVDFELDISAKGKPMNIHLLESFPGDIFVKAARASLRRYEYAPVLKNGNATVRECQALRINFRL